MNNIWPREEGDFIEIGKSGWIAIEGGRFVNKRTGEYKNSDGIVFNSMEELVRHEDAQEG